MSAVRSLLSSCSRSAACAPSRERPGGPRARGCAVLAVIGLGCAAPRPGGPGAVGGAAEGGVAPDTGGAAGGDSWAPGGPEPELESAPAACVGLRVPEAWPTLAEALAAAGPGETICLGPGVWPAVAPDPALDLRIVGENGPDETILDAQGAGRVVELDGPGALTLVGLRLRNGAAETGAALRAREVELVLEDVVIEDCRGGTSGALHLEGGALLAADLVLRGSVAQGGAVAGGALHMAGGALTLARTRIEGVEALAAGEVAGGAIWLEQVSALLDQVHITGAEARGGSAVVGGVLYARQGRLHIDQLEIEAPVVEADRVWGGVVGLEDLGVGARAVSLRAPVVAAAGPIWGGALAMDQVAGFVRELGVDGAAVTSEGRLEGAAVAVVGAAEGAPDLSLDEVGIADTTAVSGDAMAGLLWVEGSARIDRLEMMGAEVWSGGLLEAGAVWARGPSGW